MKHLLCTPTFCALLSFAQTADRPVRAVTDPGVVTTRQSITPAGVPAVFDGRVFGVCFGEQGSDLWVLNVRGLYRMDWKENKVLGQSEVGRLPGLQGVVFDAAARRPLYVWADAKRQVRLSAVEGPGKKDLAENLGANIAGALAVAAGARKVAIPLVYENKLALVDLDGRAAVQRIDTGTAPFGAVLSSDASVAYVTNWGGRRPREGDLTAPTGLSPTSDRVVVDARGITATGTVSRIDVAAGKLTHSIATGLHPTGMAWDEKRQRLYVANNNDDSVTVIDTRTQNVVSTIAIAPFTEKAAGLAPTAAALAPAGDALYVALGGINAVAVIDTATLRLRGMIPTAWYPSSLAVSGDGKRIAVGALLGAGSGWRDEPKKRFVHSYRGSVAVIDVPDAAQLAGYTRAVAENTHMRLGAPAPSAAPARPARAKALPLRAGDPSLIEHVVYIVKENRTYDQVLGDLPRGNGDPSLVMFGMDVTPNQHRLSEQFVTLDNFYATGGNSANGHQWVTQGNEMAYTLWPGYEGRSYPFDGTDPIAIARGGFLWEAALKMQKTVRIYGEYAGRMSETRPAQRAELLARWRNGERFDSEFNITPPIAAMKPLVAANYPTYTNAIPDVVRARIFLSDLEQWKTAGTMPNLVVLQLPANHTFGTTPGTSTPKAMVADNDLALGQIVEALTRTPFWQKMAILVVEDDAQNGVDHVDGHRTVALAISPYTRRGHVDSTFYSHQSLLKTIELMLGLPSLSIFDLIANELRESFHDVADATPYIAVTPRQSLDDLNPAVTALKGAARKAAIDSAKMRWDVPDAAPVAKLNRILWGAVRGWNVPYPGVRRSVFSPLSLEDDEDDDDK